MSALTIPSHASDEENCALMLTRLAQHSSKISSASSSVSSTIPRDLIPTHPDHYSQLYHRILNRKPLVSSSSDRRHSVPDSDSDLCATLLSRFDKQVLSNPQASKQLSSLRPETQEKYLYQIRRYIRHCALQNNPNFLVTKSLSLGLIESELESRGEISSNTVKSIRSPLNKLCNMNRIVYGDKQEIDPLNELVDDIFKEYLLKENVDSDSHEPCHKKRRIKSSKAPASEKKVLSPEEVALVAKFKHEIMESPQTEAVVSSLTGSTLRAYLVDIKRYVKYCARCGLRNFLLTRGTVDGFLQNEMNAHSVPSTTKLKSVRSSLLKLLQLISLAYGVVFDDTYIVDMINELIENKKIAKDEGGQCGHSNHSSSECLLSEESSSAASPMDVESTHTHEKRQEDSIEECDHSVPKLAMNGDITTVTQLLEEWTLVVKRNQRWGLLWIQTAADKQRYICRKCIIELVEELVAAHTSDGTDMSHFHAARVLDAYINHQRLTLESFANSLHDRRQGIKAALNDFSSSSVPMIS